jgi:hypothetical protein
MPLRRFSKPLLSTTQPPLRVGRRAHGGSGSGTDCVMQNDSSKTRAFEPALEQAGSGSVGPAAIPPALFGVGDQEHPEDEHQSGKNDPHPAGMKSLCVGNGFRDGDAETDQAELDVLALNFHHGLMG